MNSLFDSKVSDDDSATVKSLRERIMKVVDKDGDFLTECSAVSIHRRSTPTDEIPCIYGMGLALTVSGHKQVTLGDQVFEYSAGEALLASVDLPVVSRVIQASKAKPYLGIMVKLEPHLVVQVVNQMGMPPKPKLGSQIGLAQGKLDTALINAVSRFVDLLDEPELLPVVAPLIQQEIIARLLLSRHGPNFMHLHASASPSRQIAKSMAWLKVNYPSSVRIEDLAQQAHMSPTTFRQHFRSVSGMSPLQYLKSIRLQEARQMMLNEGLDAGEAGLQVGYESVSQFSREYARLFGMPPARDIKHLQAQV